LTFNRINGDISQKIDFFMHTFVVSSNTVTCLTHMILDFIFQTTLDNRFEVFTAVTMKNGVFWDMAQCIYCVYRRFGWTYCIPSCSYTAGCFRLVAQSVATCSRWFLAREFFYPVDGGDKFLRNVSSHKIYTAQHPRRLHSS
jgi:hypothetical protein